MRVRFLAPVVCGAIFGLAALTAAAQLRPGPDLQRTAFDFDGDRISDAVVIEEVGGNMVWHILQSTNGMRTVTFGLMSGDIPVPGDYDGDDRWDVAIWRPGSTGLYLDPSTFWILTTKGERTMAIPWGIATDNPRATQDFDGDGVADPTVVRKEGGKLVWWVLNSGGGIGVAYFGDDTDHFVRGDYDADGKADLAVYRTTDVKGTPMNLFIINRSSDGTQMWLKFGLPGDTLVPGDYDGDGATDIAVFRGNPSKWDKAAYWWWMRSSDGVVESMPFGLAMDPFVARMDCPVPGDYDSDGTTDLGIWRMIGDMNFDSEFHMLKKKGGYEAFPFGKGNMIVPNYTLQTVDTNYPQ